MVKKVHFMVCVFYHSKQVFLGDTCVLLLGNQLLILAQVVASGL